MHRPLWFARTLDWSIRHKKETITEDVEMLHYEGLEYAEMVRAYHIGSEYWSVGFFNCVILAGS